MASVLRAVVARSREALMPFNTTAVSSLGAGIAGTNAALIFHMMNSEPYVASLWHAIFMRSADHTPLYQLDAAIFGLVGGCVCLYIGKPALWPAASSASPVAVAEAILAAHPPTAEAPVIDLPPIVTSSPLIEKSAELAGVPVVPSPSPLTPAELASATEGHNQMANQLAGRLLDILLKAAEQNRPRAIELITAAEGGVEAFAISLIKKTPNVFGPLGVLLPLAEDQVIAAIQAEVAKNGALAIFDMLDTLGHNEAAALGG